jgi:hypothetical protein
MTVLEYDSYCRRSVCNLQRYHRDKGMMGPDPSTYDQVRLRLGLRHEEKLNEWLSCRLVKTCL